MGSGEIATADTRDKPEPHFSMLSCMHQFNNEVESNIQQVESDLKGKNDDDDWMFQMVGKPNKPTQNFVKVDDNIGLDTYIDFMDQFINE